MGRVRYTYTVRVRDSCIRWNHRTGGCSVWRYRTETRTGYRPGLVTVPAYNYANQDVYNYQYRDVYYYADQEQYNYQSQEQYNYQTRAVYNFQDQEVYNYRPVYETRTRTVTQTKAAVMVCPAGSQLSGLECSRVVTEQSPAQPRCPAQHTWTLQGWKCSRTVQAPPLTCDAGESYFTKHKGCRPTECEHGRDDNTGDCNPCPEGQIRLPEYNNTCQPKDCGENGRSGTGSCNPPCSAGLTRLSEYDNKCLPPECRHGRDSNGYCNPCPAGERREGPINNCVPIPCPAGQSRSAAFGNACVPPECKYGRTHEGLCESDDPSFHYETLTCTSYSTTADARTYLNVDTEKNDQAVCPPKAFFLASDGTGEWPVWGFQKSVADDYGKIVVERLGECSGPNDERNWDFPDDAKLWDFKVPCKAHDHCFDLRRAGFSSTVDEGECDDLAHDLMRADCNNRSIVNKWLLIPALSNPVLFSNLLTLTFTSPRVTCYATARLVFTALTLPDEDPNPGIVKLMNEGTALCAEVANTSQASAPMLVQKPCSATSTNQQFRIYPVKGAGWSGYFEIRPVHSEPQSLCVTIDLTAVIQNTCTTGSGSSAPSPHQSFKFRSVKNIDAYEILSRSSPAYCLTIPPIPKTNPPPTTPEARTIIPKLDINLVNSSCDTSTNSNQIWRIKNV